MPDALVSPEGGCTQPSPRSPGRIDCLDGAHAGWEDLQPVGTAACEGGLGEVCLPERCTGLPNDGEELECFERENDGALEVTEVVLFVDW